MNHGIEKSFKSKDISGAKVAHGYGDVADVPITDLIANTKAFQEGNPLNIDGSQPGSPRLPPHLSQQMSEDMRRQGSLFMPAPPQLEQLQEKARLSQAQRNKSMR